MFFDIFDRLCIEKGVSRNRALTECGISRTSAAKWQKGSVPGGKTLTALSEYFGVPVSQLLGKEEESAPAPRITEDDIKAAFFEGAGELSREDMDLLWEDARDYMQYKLEQRRRRR